MNENENENENKPVKRKSVAIWVRSYHIMLVLIPGILGSQILLSNVMVSFMQTVSLLVCFQLLVSLF